MVRVLGAEVQVAYLLSIRVALSFDSLALRGRRVADASKGPSSAHAHFGAKHFPSPRARRHEPPRGGSAVLEVDPACPAHDRHGLLCVGVCRSHSPDPLSILNRLHTVLQASKEGTKLYVSSTQSVLEEVKHTTLIHQVVLRIPFSGAGLQN